MGWPLADSGLARQRVLAELGALAFSSLSDVVSWRDGKMVVRDAANLPPEVQKAITRMECDPDTGVITKLAMDLKGPALTALAKALQLQGPQLAIGVSGEKVIVNMTAADRALL